jgi:hypothetical protein
MSVVEVSRIASIVPTFRLTKFSELEAYEKAELRTLLELTPFDTMSSVVRKLNSKEFTLWRYKNVKLILQVLYTGDSKRLHVWGLFGTGYIKNLDYIVAFLLRYAKDNECKWVTASTVRPGMERILKSVGANTTHSNLYDGG